MHWLSPRSATTTAASTATPQHTSTMMPVQSWVGSSTTAVRKAQKLVTRHRKWAPVSARFMTSLSYVGYSAPTTMSSSASSVSTIVTATCHLPNTVTANSMLILMTKVEKLVALAVMALRVKMPRNARSPVRHIQSQSHHMSMWLTSPDNGDRRKATAPMGSMSTKPPQKYSLTTHTRPW